MAIPRRSVVTAAAGRPIYVILAAFPAASFTLALLTDIAFWYSSDFTWQNFSAWLLFAGIVFGLLAGIVRLLDLLFHRQIRKMGVAWLHALVCVVVLALAVVNSFVHAGDGWTAVVPYGLVLSAATVLMMIVAALLGRSMLRRALNMSNIYG